MSIENKKSDKFLHALTGIFFSRINLPHQAIFASEKNLHVLIGTFFKEEVRPVR